MKFAAASLALISSVLAASNATVSYETETVTNQHSTEVTITSCADHKCATTVQSLTNTVVTTTVDGVETVYTTVCPLTESHSASQTGLSSVAPVSSWSSSQNITYVDITSTPTVTASTGVKSTVYQQSTFTSVYNSTTSAKPSVTLANNAQRNFFAGAAGVVGIAALLL